MQHEAPSYPEHIDERLREIDPTFRLEWEPRCTMSGVTTHRDEEGRLVKPKFEGRFELWATDNTGKDYLVSIIEDQDGQYMPPDERLIERRKRLNPERFNGDIGELVRRHVDIPAEEREQRLMKESDEAVDDGVDWGMETETVKSGRYLQYRGERMLSGGGGARLDALLRPRRIVTPSRKIIIPGGTR